MEYDEQTRIIAYLKENKKRFEGEIPFLLRQSDLPSQKEGKMIFALAQQWGEKKLGECLQQRQSQFLECLSFFSECLEDDEESRKAVACVIAAKVSPPGIGPEGLDEHSAVATQLEVIVNQLEVLKEIIRLKKTIEEKKLVIPNAKELAKILDDLIISFGRPPSLLPPPIRQPMSPLIRQPMSPPIRQPMSPPIRQPMSPPPGRTIMGKLKTTIGSPTVVQDKGLTGTLKRRGGQILSPKRKKAK